MASLVRFDRTRPKLCRCGPDRDRGRPATGRARSAVQALRIRAYRWWFLAQVLSSSGNMTAAVAQSWLVLSLTHSAFLLALTATFSFTPSLVGGAWAGSVVDRFDRRRVLLITQSSFFLLSAGLGALVALRAAPVWVVFAFAAVTGVVNAMDAPARQVFVLDLVGRDRAANAVGLNEVVINASRVLGPSVGGALIATVGVAACFFVNALSFVPPLVVVAALVARRGWQPALRRRGARPSGHVRAGLSYAWKHPAVRSCILTAVAGGMLFNMGNTLPLMATRAFHAGPQAFGAMMAAFGGGALFGALMAGSGAEAPSGRLVRSLVAVTGLEVCLTALSPAMWVLYAGLALAGFLSIWFIALANALVQLRTEPALRGRVMGAWTMALPGMLPLTSLVVGAVATWGGGGTGAREGFGLAGVALLLAAAAGWRSLGEAPASTVAVREAPLARVPAA